MAYTPTTWNDGDLITAAKLNKLEQGVQNEQAGPQGPAGADGAPGAAAGFGTPTATVDAGTGTPSVTVTASGPDTAKIFAFAFKNLKGTPGASYTLPAATTSTLGGVKQAAAVNDAAAAPTMEEFNGLLAALRSAGILAGS